MSFKYATLQEMNEEEMECWMYFIRYEGNEEALQKLQEQLSKVEFYIIEGLSTFDLELDYLVSETTAKEMTKIDLNSHSFHRKFDGKLKDIDFEFRKRDSNETKICKCFDVLGYGQIEDYIDGEDIDEEDLVSCDEEEDDDEEEEATVDEEAPIVDDTKPRRKHIPKVFMNRTPNYIKEKKQK